MKLIIEKIEYTKIHKIQDIPQVINEASIEEEYEQISKKLHKLEISGKQAGLQKSIFNNIDYQTPMEIETNQMTEQEIRFNRMFKNFRVKSKAQQSSNQFQQPTLQNFYFQQESNQFSEKKERKSSISSLQTNITQSASK